MGMPAVITQNGTGTSSIWFPDWMQNPFNIGIQCIATGTVTFNVEHTFDNIDVTNGVGPFSTVNLPVSAASATWIANPGVSLATTTINGNYAFPVRALRVNVVTAANATAGVTVQFIQANYGGS